MTFSNSTQYAIRGLAELALAEQGVGGQPVMLDRLTAGRNLPRDFLAKVFQKLVRAQLLRSAKGRGGGFSLNRPAGEITLMQIIEAVDGPQLLDSCVVGLERCSEQTACPQHESYKAIRERLKEYLNTTTLAQLAASLRMKMERQRRGVEMGVLGGEMRR